MEAVVQALVIGVIEALLLKRPFQVPVDFGQEDEFRVGGAGAGDGLRPERGVNGRRAVGGQRLLAPDAPNDVGQQQHRHVAADGVAAVGHAQQLADHGAAQGGGAVVELHRVGPAGEVGVAAVGQDARAVARRDPAVVMRLARQVAVVASQVILRVFPHPGVVDGRVVGHEVQEQAQAAAAQPLAQVGQRLVAAEVGADAVRRDGEGRADEVLVGQVGQLVRGLAPPVGVGARRRPAVLPGLPHAERPEQVEAEFRQLIEPRVGHVVQSGGPAQPLRQLAQPDGRVDLVQRRVQGTAHNSIRPQ